MKTHVAPRWLRGLAVAAATFSWMLLTACAEGDNRGAVSPTATSTSVGVGAVPPATATPRPAKVVVEPEPSFVPRAAASRTIVLRSDSTSLAVDTDTGDVREVMQAPPAPGRQNDPVFSPDGRSYAFACDESGGRPDTGYRNNLCVSRAGSASPQIVARRGPLEAFGAYPPTAIDWSPDGRRIAFRKSNRDNAEVNDVYVVDLATLVTTRVITNAGHEPWGPVTWSPDGTRFIIQRLWAGSSPDLLAVNASTGESIDLTQGLERPGTIPEFSWSPDGQEVAFVSAHGTEPDESGVFVIAVAGGSPRKIMDGPTAWKPAWSPDGRWIAVTSAVRDAGSAYVAYRVIVVRADGGEERALPDEALNSTRPVWAPDSSHLAVRGTLQGRTGIVVTSIRGATPILVSEQRSASHPDFVMWSADAKRLFFTEGGGCGRGGCTPGFLQMADLESGAPPRKLYDREVDEIVSPQPE